MNAQDFLVGLPVLPSRSEHRAKNWIPLDDFLAKIGEISKERTFAGNTGGEPNDSLRGFGPTSQLWQHTTSNGWSVLCEDDLIVCATDPDGHIWRYRTIGFTLKYWYVREDIENEFEKEFSRKLEAASGARSAYLNKQRPNQIPLKFNGYYLEASGLLINNNLGKMIYSLDPSNDLVTMTRSGPTDDWYHNGLTIQEIF